MLHFTGSELLHNLLQTPLLSVTQCLKHCKLYRSFCILWTLLTWVCMSSSLNCSACASSTANCNWVTCFRCASISFQRADIWHCMQMVHQSTVHIGDAPECTTWPVHHAACTLCYIAWLYIPLLSVCRSEISWPPVGSKRKGKWHIHTCTSVHTAANLTHKQFQVLPLSCPILQALNTGISWEQFAPPFAMLQGVAAHSDSLSYSHQGSNNHGIL